MTWQLKLSRVVPRWRLVISAVLASMIGEPAATAARPRPAERIQWFDVPRDLPAATRLSDLSGKPFALGHAATRLVVLNFWATWCLPCVAELPQLARLRAILASRGIVVVAVAVDQDAATINRFLASHRLPTSGVLRDEDAVFARAIGVRSLPTSIVIRPGRGEIARVKGYLEWMDSSVARVLLARRDADYPPTGRRRTTP